MNFHEVFLSTTLVIGNLNYWGETKGPVGSPYITINAQLVSFAQQYLFAPIRLLVACTIVHEIGHCWIRKETESSPKKFLSRLPGPGDDFGFVLESLMFDSIQGVFLFLKKSTKTTLSNARSVSINQLSSFRNCKSSDFVVIIKRSVRSQANYYEMKASYVKRITDTNNFTSPENKDLVHWQEAQVLKELTLVRRDTEEGKIEGEELLFSDFTQVSRNCGKVVDVDSETVIPEHFSEPNLSRFSFHAWVFLVVFSIVALFIYLRN